MALVLAACGSSDNNGSGDDGVASLGTATTVAGEESPDTTVDPQQAMLDYTQCMRDNGIDMPDPEFSEDGNGAIAITQSAGGDGDDKGFSIDPESEKFKAAQEECQPIMDAAVGTMEVDPEQQAEMRQQLLDYAQCMRDQGIDFPDPTFSDNGMVTMGNGPGADGEQPSDSELEAMDAANEVCAKDGGPIAIGAAPTKAGD
jgi:hypothetical protein